MMTEDEARAVLDVPRETMHRLEQFVDVLRAENSRQNLVSSSSMEHVWSRHILDSAQLMRFAPEGNASWLDLGSGPGFPGLIIATLQDRPITLVESRKLRAEFLQRAAASLGVEDRTTVICARIEKVPTEDFGVITARAFAPLQRLLALAERFAAPETRWILPKGRNAQSELEAAESMWQGDFRLEASLTDADAKVIIAEGVRRKPRGKSGR